MAKSKKPEEMAQDAQSLNNTEEVTGKYEGMSAEEIQRMEAENMARDAERAAQEERINYEGNPIPNPTPPADYVDPNAPKVPQPRVLAELFGTNNKIRVELYDAPQQGSNNELIQDLANRVISCETRLENTTSKTNYAYEEIYGGGDRYLEDGAILDRTRLLERQVGNTGMDTKPLVERVEALETQLQASQKVIDWLGGGLLTIKMIAPDASQGKCYATRMFPYAVLLPKGIDAYKVENFSTAGSSTLEIMGDGKTVPAYTPVVLIADKPGTYNLSPIPYTAPIETGLMGTLQPLASDKLDNDKFNYYIMTVKNNKITWIAVGEEYTLSPYRAYIRAPKN